MLRSARKFVPAVAVIAVLGTGWASATTTTHPGGPPPASVRATTADGGPQGPGAAPVTEAPHPTTVPPGAPVAPVAPGAPVASPEVVKSAPPRDAVNTAPVPTAEGTAASPARPRTSGELADCAVGEGTYHPATEAAFRTAMTGVWLLCRPPSVFGTSEAGMELRPDGRWSKLERRPNGALARAEGLGNEGAWATVDTSAMNGGPTYQLNLHVDGGGTTMTTPGFGQGSTTALVTKVHLDNMGLFVADYVPAPPDTRLVPPLPAPGKGCDGRQASYAPASEAEFRAAMTRRWLLCGAPSFFGTGEDGLEVGADGRWFKLYRTSRDSLVRGTGPADAGTWETFDTSAMNGRPTYQINFDSQAGGTYMATPAFTGRIGDVAKVRLDNNGAFVADYIPAPARTSS